MYLGFPAKKIKGDNQTQCPSVAGKSGISRKYPLSIRKKTDREYNFNGCAKK
jgi:hypothetical protein